MKRLNIDWESLDWRKTDQVLANELGCSLTLVWQARCRLKKPRAKYLKSKKLAVAPQDLDWTKTNTVLSIQHGVTKERIRQLRKAQGLPSSKTLYRPRQLDATKTAAELAVEHGVTRATIYHNAYKLGIKLAKPLKKHDWSRVDWKQRTGHIAAQMGMMPQQVVRARHRHAPWSVRQQAKRKGKVNP